jgi:hypothetical protein
VKPTKQKPLPELPASVLSVQDIQSLIVEVKQYAKWLSHQAVRQRAELESPAKPPTFSPAATGLITHAGTDVDGLLAGLEEIRDSAPRLTITLAAPATGELKRTLASWCRENIEPNVLVSFQFNSTLLGGMVVRYGSHIFDWSFRRQILSQRNKFPAILRGKGAA